MEQFNQPAEDFDVEGLRFELEKELLSWSHPQQGSPEEVVAWSVIVKGMFLLRV